MQYKTLVLCGNDHRDTTRIESYIQTGLLEFSDTVDWINPSDPNTDISGYDLIVSVGIRNNQEAILNRAKELKKPGILIDLGFIDRAFTPHDVNKYWYCGLYKLNWLPGILTNKDRLYSLLPSLGNQRAPSTNKTRGGPKPVLLALQKPGDFSHKMNEEQIIAWAQRQVTLIRKYTDREIVCFKHPLHVGEVDIPGTVKKELDTMYWLYHCHCLVTYNSTVGILANVVGTPVFCNSSASYFPHSYKNKYELIENLGKMEIKPRREYLGRLTHTQFTGPEIATGNPFLNLLSYYKGIVPSVWLRAARNHYCGINVQLIEDINRNVTHFTKKVGLIKAYIQKFGITYKFRNKEDIENFIATAKKVRKAVPKKGEV